MSKRTFTVYFEIYGKKLRAKITANTAKDAENAVRDKVIFHKTIADKGDYFNKSMDILDGLCDSLGIKK